MKEFKTSKQNKKDKLAQNDDSELLFGNDDPIDKKITEDLKEIKDKLNAEKLSDEFKLNLKAKLQEELNKTEDSDKGKIIKFPNLTRKLAGICACFVFLFSSCLVFADDIENVILELFCNTDKIIANAIEEGNYKEIDMDYVEDQGVSIKVDYVVVEDDELYIAFNILGQENCDKVLLDDIDIKEQNGNVLYTVDVINNNSKLNIADTCVDKNNTIVIYKITEVQYDLKKLELLEIEINNIKFIKSDNIVDRNVSLKLNIYI